VATTFQHAESHGTVSQGLGHATDSLFDDVYVTLPTHLQNQRAELQTGEKHELKGDPSILSFTDVNQRAAG
jgi:hypothetical protein